MKKYLFGALAIVIAVGLSAFTTKKAHKPTVKTYYYKANKNFQRVEGGQTMGAFPTRSISADANYGNPSSQLETQGNWSLVATDAYVTTPPAAYNTTTPDGSSFVWQFTIDSWEATTNGINDGAISLEEALIALDDYHQINGNLPTTATYTVGSTTLSGITKAENVH